MKAFFQIQKFFTLVAIVASLGFITACGSDSDDDAATGGGGSFTVKMEGGANPAGVASAAEHATAFTTVTTSYSATTLTGAGSGKLCKVEVEKGGKTILFKEYAPATYVFATDPAGTFPGFITAFGGAVEKFGLTLTFTKHSSDPKLIVTTQANFVVAANDGYVVKVTHQPDKDGDCTSSIQTLDLPALVSGDATTATKKSVAASGFVVVPHGLAKDPDTDAPHNNQVIIDGVGVGLGPKELSTDKVADEMIKSFNTIFGVIAAAAGFADEKDAKKLKMGVSYRKSPYVIEKKKGLDTSSEKKCGKKADKHKPTKDTICLRFTRIFPGTAGNGDLKLTSFTYAKSKPKK